MRVRFATPAGAALLSVLLVLLTEIPAGSCTGRLAAHRYYQPSEP